ncbi:MAG: YfbR-like 5'-deoxynucleotidase [Candidatus Paceibacterota bacterium]
METLKNLLSWKRREENLFKIKRYHKFKVMFYRTNNLLHSKRVLSLLEEILPIVKSLYPDFDEKKARLIALHHDNHEIILEGGDIPLQYKLMMSKEELSDLQQKEISAVEILSKSYPKTINGYDFKKLSLHAIYKDCIEAQAVSFIDKIDAYCEAIHEILAGNNIFLEPIINYHARTFSRLHKNYPLIKELFEIENVWFDFDYVVDLKEYYDDGLLGPKPHTQESIEKYTLIPQYEKWKKTTILNFGIKPLINQVEFPIISTILAKKSL